MSRIVHTLIGWYAAFFQPMNERSSALACTLVFRPLGADTPPGLWDAMYDSKTMPFGRFAVQLLPWFHYGRIFSSILEKTTFDETKWKGQVSALSRLHICQAPYRV